jgi:hypothetical protein
LRLGPSPQFVAERRGVRLGHGAEDAVSGERRLLLIPA